MTGSRHAYHIRVWLTPCILTLFLLHQLASNPLIFQQTLRNKIGEAMERLKEIYILRELRNAEASSPNGASAVPSAPLVPAPTPAPEQVRGKGDTLGGTESQNYQSIHEGAFKDYNPAPWPGVGSGPRPTLSGGLFNGYIDGRCITIRSSTFKLWHDSLLTLNC